MIALFAAAALAVSGEPKVENPTWERLPDADEVGRAYPKLAAFVRLSGWAVIECRVEAEGSLQDCEVVDESVSGFGFGSAALAASLSFRMTPLRLDGVATSLGTARIPIRFMLPEPEHSGRPPPDFSGVDQRTVAMARRLARAQGWVEQAASSVEAVYKNSSDHFVQDTDPKLRSEVLDAMAQAIRRHGSGREDIVAANFVKAMSYEQLEASVRYFESDAGKAQLKVLWTNLNTSPEQDIWFGDLDADVVKTARELVCAKRDCGENRVPSEPAAEQHALTDAHDQAL